MREQKEPEMQSGNLTAMIDVVFQIIIFFVVSTNLQNTIDDRIKLAISPHAKPVTGKDPREIKIDVDSKGNISISRYTYSARDLGLMIKKAVADYGADIPIVIRGDQNTKHSAMKVAMDACTDARLWKIKFSVLKEKGK